jgi:hypothetical protein
MGNTENKWWVEEILLAVDFRPDIILARHSFSSASSQSAS